MNSEEYKIRVEYSKNNQARYIAHLDTIDVISKALRRLQLPYAITQGCHVRPKLSFGPPLPLGHASHCEFFIISLIEQIDPVWLKNSLSNELPAGMNIEDVKMRYEETKKQNYGDIVEYRFRFTRKETAFSALTFLQNPETEFSAVQKGKTRHYRLEGAVQKAELSANDDGTFAVFAEFNQGKANVPSVSKIVTALSHFLQEKKDDFILMERLAIRKLFFTGEKPLEPKNIS